MFKTLNNLYWLARGVRVFALVGGSGTGKSFRAKLVAQKFGIDMIIDDGLLINGDAIVAGKSAKREKLYMAAVKTALFHEKSHRDEVARILQHSRWKKILIIGTSEKMVRKIAERLQIPSPGKVIKIEDIASRDDIDTAIRARKVEGKHVIPVPAIEIKRNYPQIFYDSIRVFLQRNLSPGGLKTPKLYEKSVVRPEFSKRGRVAISESALSQMVIHCIDEFDDSIRIQKITVRSDSQGYRLTVVIEVPFGSQLSGRIHNLQQYIIDNIERFTGILIEEVNLVIDRFSR
ncbi:MAG: ATP-binding protein [Spirochaetales bacterium]|nr:ATP-binding protein [Spirochaetales bacterium]